MSDNREPNHVQKASKQQLPKVNSTESDRVIQNKQRRWLDNKEEFANDMFFENFTVYGNKFIDANSRKKPNKEDK